MSIFRRAMNRLADFRWIDRKVTLRFTAEYRTARYALPLIKKLICEDGDGEAYRVSLIDWHRAERPPHALYHGTSSFCRVDGPLQWVKDRAFPLGGLILSPGVTAHLNPFEAQDLHDHMRWVIEQAIRTWAADHNLYDTPPVPVEIDRHKSDREAKAMIADWAAQQGKGSCSDEPGEALCAACRKGLDHG